MAVWEFVGDPRRIVWPTKKKQQFEWFDGVRGTVSGSGQIKSSGGSQSFKAPFQQAAVLYLKAVDER